MSNTPLINHDTNPFVASRIYLDILAAETGSKRNI